jgi:hypothetical protein
VIATVANLIIVIEMINSMIVVDAQQGREEQQVLQQEG